MSGEGGTNRHVDEAAVERYLDALSTKLRMPPEAAGDVLDEVAAHIEDAIVAGIAEGLTREVAERRALERLGPPDALGQGLRRTHQTRRKLLAAAGGGVWHGVRGLARGYASGVVIAIASLFGVGLVFVVVALIARGLRFDFASSVLTSNSLQPLTFVPLWVALWYAGRESTIAVSARSLRSIRSIRLPIALTGGFVGSLFVIFMPADHTHLGVALALVTPAVFPVSVWTADREIGPWLFGATWESLRTRLQHHLFQGFVGLLVAIIAVSIVEIATGLMPSRPATDDPSDGSTTAEERWRAAGYELVAPTVFDVGRFILSASAPKNGFVEADLRDDLVDWDRWGHLRFEVWPTTGSFGLDHGRIVDDHPMAIVPIDDPRAPRSYSIRVGYPDADGYLLFLVADDRTNGQRVALGEPSDGQSIFHGSLIEWFQPR